MGREERRRQERLARKQGGTVKKPDEKVLKRFTEEEFEQFIYDIEYRARINTIQQLMVAFSLAEHRVHKHGHIRVKRTLDYVNGLMDDINSGKTNFEKLKEQCIEETGINFVL